jgi:predicted alpha/beta hydrolase
MHNDELAQPKWHIAMPILSAVFGYFPAKRLGWMKDTPKGVVREWANSRARFQDSWRGRSAARYWDKQAPVQQFTAITAPILAVGITDDEFGTVPAIERLLAYFHQSPRIHLRITPQSIQEPQIGHFGFFNSRFEHKLWPLPLEWLTSGRIPADFSRIQTHFAPEPVLALSPT